MSPLALGGLASGLDTETIVTQLMSVERQPRTRLTLADTRAQARQTALKELASKLRSVRDAASAMRSAGTWADVQNVTSSDPARVAARATGSVAPGSHVLEVSRLATTAQQAFTYASSATATQQISITPTAPGATAFTLDVAAGATLASVASAINADDDAPVRAIVAAGRLVLTSRTSGADGDFVVGGPVGLLVNDAAHSRAGVNALYSVDGVAQAPSASNLVTSAVLGAELRLKSTTSAPVTIDVTDPAVDADGVKAKVTAFVTAYDNTVDFIRARLSEKTVKEPSTTSEATKGLFNGDSMLTSVLASMRSSIGDLADLGISTGATTGASTISADAVAGHLTLDADELDAALAAGATTLRTRLEGLGDRLGAVIAPVVGAGIDERLSSVEATRKRLATSMAAMDVRLATREKRLRAQFAAMEAALAAGQAAQAQMSAQLGSLS